LISEFDSIVRLRLNCIVQYEGSVIEAEEVVFLLDQANTPRSFLHLFNLL
jgi:hypothetical protein